MAQVDTLWSHLVQKFEANKQDVHVCHVKLNLDMKLKDSNLNFDAFIRNVH